jgi:mRNA interferase RelE/StbE
LSYELFIERSAQKALSKIPDPYQERIIEAIKALGKEPRPPDCKKLSGREAWRIRVGNYRVIYEIDDKINKVLIILVSHRREIYRF